MRMHTVNYLRERLYRPPAQVDSRSAVPEARVMPGEEPLRGQPLGFDARGDGRLRTRPYRNGLPVRLYVWRGDTPANQRRRREADAAYEEDTCQPSP